MNNYQYINLFINILKRRKVFDLLYGIGRNSKSKILFKQFAKGKIKNEQDVARLLKSSIGSEPYRNFLSKFREKITGYLFLIDFRQEKKAPDLIKNEFHAYRLFYAMGIIRLFGYLDESKTLALKALRITKKNKIFHLQIAILKKLKEFYAFDANLNQVLRLQSELELCTDLLLNQEKILLIEQKFFAEVVHSLDIKKESIEKLESSLDIMKTLMSEELPLRCHFAEWRLKLYIEEFRNNFQVVFDLSNSYFEIIQNDKSGRLTWLLDLYIQLLYSIRALNLNNYSIQEKSSYLEENLLESSPHYLTYLELTIFYFIDTKQIKKALNLFQKAQSNVNYGKVSQVEAEHWILLEHVFHYISANYNTTLDPKNEISPTPFHEISLLRKDSRGFQVCVSILEMSLALLKGEDYRTEQLLDKIHNDYYAFIRESDTERTIHFYKLMRKRLQKRPEEFHNDPRVQTEIEEMKKSPRTMKTLEGWEIIPYDLVFEWDRENHLIKSKQTREGAS